ncbi:MAG: beta-ribofuranosylaminobenzene 5'-phosphate synthase [Planctomycetaceae bacterium]
MTDCVTITTGSRLHFGPLAHGSQSPPFFGGVGLMLDSPGFQIKIQRADQDEILATPEYAERIVQFRRQFHRRFDVPESPCRIEICETIPLHRGFGSGTQLALAMARGLSRLYDTVDVPIEQLACRMNRGCRSAVGLWGFDRGGFLVDAGKLRSDQPGRLAARCPLPEEWRFLLVIPEGEPGLSGDEEFAAFAELHPMTTEMTNRLCRIVLMDWLPAVRSADFKSFAQSLTEYGNVVGDYFAPAQGGRFRHPEMRTLLKEFSSHGRYGIAQSSWGPSICIAVETLDEAETLISELKQHSACRGSRIHLAKPLNAGARIERSSLV